MARRRKQNEVPFVPILGAVTFYSTGTADGDALTTIIVPSDAALSRGVIAGITNGTGTALIVPAYYSAASRGGTKLSREHVNAAGGSYDLDAAAGVVYTADYNAWPPPFLAEGSRLFLNLDFDGGSATGAGTFAVAFFLVL